MFRRRRISINTIGTSWCVYPEFAYLLVCQTPTLYPPAWFRQGFVAIPGSTQPLINRLFVYTFMYAVWQVSVWLGGLIEQGTARLSFQHRISPSQHAQFKVFLGLFSTRFYIATIQTETQVRHRSPHTEFK